MRVSKSRSTVTAPPGGSGAGSDSVSDVLPPGLRPPSISVIWTSRAGWPSTATLLTSIDAGENPPGYSQWKLTSVSAGKRLPSALG